MSTLGLHQPGLETAWFFLEATSSWVVGNLRLAASLEELLGPGRSAVVMGAWNKEGIGTPGLLGILETISSLKSSVGGRSNTGAGWPGKRPWLYTRSLRSTLSSGEACGRTVDPRTIYPVLPTPFLRPCPACEAISSEEPAAR